MNSLEKTLLHAILDEDKKTSMESFNNWTSSIDFDHVEAGSFRLIPSLYRKMSLINEDFENKNRMKGIYRYFLYKNRMIMHNSLKVLESFDENNIECILLKGAALVSSYYEEPALRPMNDIDLLVRREDAEKAYLLLEKAGWYNREEGTFHTKFKNSNQIALGDDRDFHLDLHWDVIFQSCWKGSEESYWENIETVNYMGRYVKILNPEMQIVHNMAHGLRWNRVSAIRWIPDVMKVMEKRRNDIDWDKIIKLAGEKKLIFTIKQGMNFLDKEFSTDMPKSFMDKMNAIPYTKIEKKLYHHLNNPSRFGGFMIGWYIYSKGMENASFIVRMTRLPAYLKIMWNVDTYSQVASLLWKKTVRKLKRRNKK